MVPVSITSLLFVSTSLAMALQVLGQGTINGPTSNGNECCGLHLMDSASRRVVIETSRSGIPELFHAVRLRVCTTDSVLLQLWRQIDDKTYEFRWQLEFTPSPTQTTLTYVTIPLSSGITTDASDRIGFYSAGNQLLIPFTGNHSSTVQLSATLIENLSQQFTTGQRITLDSYQWPRSFQSYVVLCRTPDCSDQPKPVTTVGSNPSDTVSAGDSSSNGQCCDSTVGCDPSSGVTDSLSFQTTYLRQLQEQLNSLNDKINSFVSRNYVTGLCPQGFLSGRYGIGSCYIMFQLPVSLAAAFTDCRTYGAYLLAIETELEEQFIKDFVGNNSASGPDNVASFWTSGWYDSSQEAWFWLSSPSTQLTTASNKREITFSKWQNNVKPLPKTSNDICLLLNVNRNQDTDYWANGFCSATNFYICEIPKQCL